MNRLLLTSTPDQIVPRLRSLSRPTPDDYTCALMCCTPSILPEVVTYMLSRGAPLDENDREIAFNRCYAASLIRLATDVAPLSALEFDACILRCPVAHLPAFYHQFENRTSASQRVIIDRLVDAEHFDARETLEALGVATARDIDRILFACPQTSIPFIINAVTGDLLEQLWLNVFEWCLPEHVLPLLAQLPCDPTQEMLDVMVKRIPTAAMMAFVNESPAFKLLNIVQFGTLVLRMERRHVFATCVQWETFEEYDYKLSDVIRTLLPAADYGRLALTPLVTDINHILALEPDAVADFVANQSSQLTEEAFTMALVRCSRQSISRIVREWPHLLTYGQRSLVITRLHSNFVATFASQVQFTAGDAMQILYKCPHAEIAGVIEFCSEQPAWLCELACRYSDRVQLPTLSRLFRAPTDETIDTLYRLCAARALPELWKALPPAASSIQLALIRAADDVLSQFITATTPPNNQVIVAMRCHEMSVGLVVFEETIAELQLQRCMPTCVARIFTTLSQPSDQARLCALLRCHISTLPLVFAAIPNPTDTEQAFYNVRINSPFINR